ncbi:type II toxin-antitoxin system RelE family toxin [Methanobrevibacter filiformis]|uniref:Plasmid stabilization system protein n=1 Tax=Methanobrevibacter filiformis TaxID=55758 RepID=A0A166AM76_9EURY|nr:type II toxin-antitoxin system RelE/ParE family toxin [Methanobrevibacter filiformis]KZX12221.1 hypothetical protein MBFIL_11830 [Methanobrevibacter filiformis]
MIWEGVHEIKEDPYNSKLLKHSFKGYRRKRKGDYRIIFDILFSMDPKRILILQIGKRSNIYK